VPVLFSGIGNYGGQGWIGQPRDSITVAVVSVGIYLWAVRAGGKHIEETAGKDVADSPAVSDALSAVALASAVPVQAGPSDAGTAAASADIPAAEPPAGPVGGSAEP
jgi:hypothetical protein